MVGAVPTAGGDGQFAHGPDVDAADRHLALVSDRLRTDRVDVADYDAGHDAASGYADGVTDCADRPGAADGSANQSAGISVGLHRAVDGIRSDRDSAPMAVSRARLVDPDDEQPQFHRVRSHSDCERPLSIHAVENGLSCPLPDTHGISSQSWTARLARRIAIGLASRSLLRGVLLGGNAGNVRRGHHERAVDGRDYARDLGRALCSRSARKRPETDRARASGLGFLCGGNLTARGTRKMAKRRVNCR